MRLQLEDEGLYLSNDGVTLVNMDLGIVKEFERDEEGFIVVPREFITAPCVLVVRDGALKKYYVVTKITEKDVELQQVRKKSILKNVAVGHVIASLGGEAPIGGKDKEKAMSYLRVL